MNGRRSVATLTLAASITIPISASAQSFGASDLSQRIKCTSSSGSVLVGHAPLARNAIGATMQIFPDGRDANTVIGLVRDQMTYMRALAPKLHDPAAAAAAVASIPAPGPTPEHTMEGVNRFLADRQAESQAYLHMAMTGGEMRVESSGKFVCGGLRPGLYALLLRTSRPSSTAPNEAAYVVHLSLGSTTAKRPAKLETTAFTQLASFGP